MGKYFEELKQKYQPKIEEQIINDVLNNDLLGESMKYSLKAKAKRIRPLLIIAVILDFNKEVTLDVYKVAAALEWIHTYSLIHDDLPAMDDDDLRRGVPTNHKVYGEATAILTGDALLTDAFYLVASTNLSPEIKSELILKMSFAAGSRGMIQGQMLDIKAENQNLPIEKVQNIHKLKTGALIEYAVYAGSLLASTTASEKQALLNYAKHLGLAFQIRDDILDVIGSTEELGKETGRDEELEKSTYPKVYGIDGSIEILNEEIKAAIKSLEDINLEMNYLKDLIKILEVKK